MSWQDGTLGDLLSMKRGYDLPEDDRKQGDIPVVGSAGITGYHNEAKVIGGGVTIGRSGNSFGKVFYCSGDFWPHNAAMYVNDYKGNDKKYIFYFLSNINFENYNSGSAQPSLNRNYVYPIKIKIPSLSIQRKIASILSAYDDLIENNTKRIKLLEEAAQNIYKEWFVHFRFPGYEKAQFKNGLPEGWRKERIKNVIDFHIGGGWGKDDFEGNFTENAYVIRGTDIPKIQQGNVKEVPSRFHTRSNLQNRMLKEGDIIFEVSGGSKTQPVGRSLLMTEAIFSMLNSNNVIPASFCKLISPNTNLCSSYFLESFLKDGYTNGLISSFENQSASNIINFRFNDFIDKGEIAIPNRKVLLEFDKIMQPMKKQIGNCLLQNQQLKEARDILLPRLMNRTIEVNAEVEELVV